ncbi:SOS response-associated peptidase family protein [Pseudomonas sp.]|uniref:SOS response-associated peptidase family protein n=1 Tax=Pseudomonas sp. TaxID=306 RepID=UPI002E306986|nr:SOS response-associated peptidase family protein [Pseudomonas sp.]HEX4547774.1 SOS response-associated peptidase family protein [Pseudomonas sp.]
MPYWAKDLKVGFANINAKAEGIETKLAFREAFQRRRCLVPVEEPADTSTLKALLAPFPLDGMIYWPVNARVGNVKNNDASLIEPINAVSH